MMLLDMIELSIHTNYLPEIVHMKFLNLTSTGTLLLVLEIRDFANFFRMRS